MTTITDNQKTETDVLGLVMRKKHKISITDKTSGRTKSQSDTEEELNYLDNLTQWRIKTVSTFLVQQSSFSNFTDLSTQIESHFSGMPTPILTDICSIFRYTSTKW